MDWDLIPLINIYKIKRAEYTLELMMMMIIIIIIIIIVVVVVITSVSENSNLHDQPNWSKSGLLGWLVLVL